MSKKRNNIFQVFNFLYQNTYNDYLINKYYQKVKKIINIILNN